MNIIRWDGTKITKPGIYSGIPLAQYHGDLCDGPSISSRGLRMIEARTPSHYYATSYINPLRVVETRNEAVNFGRAARALILGESSFNDQYSIRPEAWTDWRTRVARQWRKEQEASGKIVLIPSQVRAIHGITQALERGLERGLAKGLEHGSEQKLRHHQLVRDGLLNGLIEHTIVCRDEPTGLWLKIRPDIVPMADGVLIDFKNTNDASPDGVLNSILKFNYPMQDALAAMVMKKALGLTITDFVLVFFEKEAPHAVSITSIDNEWISCAQRHVRRAIDTFARCVETNEWPGYDIASTIHMPESLRTQFEDESGLIPELEAA